MTKAWDCTYGVKISKIYVYLCVKKKKKIGKFTGTIKVVTAFIYII